MKKLAVAGLVAAALLLAVECAVPTQQTPEVDLDAPPPSMDLPATPKPRPHETTESAAVPRLRPEAFPGLPEEMVAVLQSRDCLIPQPTEDGDPTNAIRGEFFEAGREGWAVVCSNEGMAEILAFRDSSDPDPDVVESFADPLCYAETSNCGMLWGRNISVADRDYILIHQQRYGGPAPPPVLDHHGINVEIWEKGSVVRYYHEGEWLSLAGAD